MEYKSDGPEPLSAISWPAFTVLKWPRYKQPSDFESEGRDRSGLLINGVDLDIVPAQFDAFIAAAKINGAATPHDRGAHEFNIVVSQKEPHQVLFFEVYDNAAALDAHRQTEHFKTYQAATKNMVANRKLNSVHFGRDV